MTLAAVAISGGGVRERFQHHRRRREARCHTACGEPTDPAPRAGAGFTLFSRNGSVAHARDARGCARDRVRATRAARDAEHQQRGHRAERSGAAASCVSRRTHRKLDIFCLRSPAHFRRAFPKVQLSLHEAALDEIAEMARSRACRSRRGERLARWIREFRAVAGSRRLEPRLVVPRTHTLASAAQPTLAQNRRVPRRRSRSDPGR